jgi:hypothetical protein
MSGPERRRVRVRRSPRIGVFLVIGVAVGALVAIVVGNLAPSDSSVPAAQATGFLVLVLAPIGAVAAGLIALVLDRAAERNARTVEAELVAPPAPEPEPDPGPEPEPEPERPSGPGAERA